MELRSKGSLRRKALRQNNLQSLGGNFPALFEARNKNNVFLYYPSLAAGRLILHPLACCYLRHSSSSNLKGVGTIQDPQELTSTCRESSVSYVGASLYSDETVHDARLPSLPPIACYALTPLVLAPSHIAGLRSRAEFDLLLRVE